MDKNMFECGDSMPRYCSRISETAKEFLVFSAATLGISMWEFYGVFYMNHIPTCEKKVKKVKFKLASERYIF